MAWPNPCAECGGVDEHAHSPLCPAVLRGAGSVRNLCNSKRPQNSEWLCEKPKHHEAADPVCGGRWARYGPYREWLYQDAERRPSVELDPHTAGRTS